MHLDLTTTDQLTNTTAEHMLRCIFVNQWARSQHVERERGCNLTLQGIRTLVIRLLK